MLIEVREALGFVKKKITERGEIVSEPKWPVEMEQYDMKVKYLIDHLSPEGKKKLTKIEESEPETVRDYLDNLSPDRLDEFIKVVEKTWIEELRLIMAGLLDEREEE